MPVYEYKCSSGHQYEKSEGFDAPTRQACVKCGAPARRQISMPAVIFKGSGFYSTDNRKSGGGNGASADSKTSKASADGHGHSHGDGDGHSHGSEPKAEAATE